MSNSASHPEQTAQCMGPVLQSPSLRGALTGLKLGRHDELLLDPNSFPCCGGQGVRVEGAWELSQCDLKRRLRRVNMTWAQLLTQLGKGAALELLKGLAPHDEHRVLTHLAAFKSGKLRRGLGMRSGEGFYVSPWLVSLIATWRYAVACHTVQWNHGSPSSWIPPESFWDAEGERMILIADVDQLWDPARAFDLEWFVSQAYQTETPLWLSFAAKRDRDPVDNPDRAATSAQNPRRTQAFRGLIAGLKGKIPTEWLTPEMQDKLVDVCECTFLHNGTSQTASRKQNRERPV